MARKVINAGTTAADSDTGARVAEKINAMTDELYSEDERLSSELKQLNEELKAVTAGIITIDPDNPFLTLDAITNPQENCLYIIGAVYPFEWFMYLNGKYKSFGQWAIDPLLFVARDEINAPNGVAPLDKNGLLPPDNLPKHTHYGEDLTVPLHLEGNVSSTILGIENNGGGGALSVDSNGVSATFGASNWSTGMAISARNESSNATINAINSSKGAAINAQSESIPLTLINLKNNIPFTINGVPFEIPLVIIRIEFAKEFKGLPFTISATDFNFEGIVPDSLVDSIIVPRINVSYLVSITPVIIRKAVTPSEFGITAVTIEYTKTDLHNLTWPQINEVAIAGKMDSYGWMIGDEVDIQLTTGEVLTFRIIGFNHDDLTSGGKAPITFAMRNLMASRQRMNATNTNVGGFVGSEMFERLNNGDIWHSLPEDLRAAIKPVNKRTGAGGGVSQIVTDSMRVWFFSQTEVSNLTVGTLAGQGAQYPIYTNDASRIKRLSNGAGAAAPYWQRTPEFANATFNTIRYRTVNSSGLMNAGANAAPISYDVGVCFGFCI